MRTLRATIPLSLILLLLTGCRQGTAPAAAVAPPEKPRAESDLGRITISKDAVASLQIISQPATIKPVQERRRLTGWVMPRPGAEVTLTAPVAGHVRLPAGAMSFPFPGEVVKESLQPLLMVDPVLSPLEQIQLATLKRGVENEEAKARASSAVAKAELERVQELVQQKLRGRQDLEQAQGRLQYAEEDLKAARDKLKLFGEATGTSGAASLPLLAVQAPFPGTIVSVNVGPGQYVPAAAPLLTLIDLKEVWLRVPIPEQDLTQISLDEPALVTARTKTTGKGFEPGQHRPQQVWQARPIKLTPQVDPVKRTADVCYALEFSGPPPRLAREQMLAVEVPLGSRTEECVVPYSAVVYDAQSGAWVYLDKTDKSGPAYARQRVELGPSLGQDIVIRPALPPGARVVVQGAADLFSREFHKPPVVRGNSK